MRLLSKHDDNAAAEPLHHRDLRTRSDEPYKTPPVVPRPEQLNLNMQRLGQPVSFSRNSRLGDLVSNPPKSGFQTVANTGGRFRFRAILDSSVPIKHLNGNGAIVLCSVGTKSTSIVGRISRKIKAEYSAVLIFLR